MSFESASVLAFRLRSGEVSASEVVLQQLELLHETDRRTHAVAWFEDAFVEHEAKRLDTLFARDRSQIGPLHGVPITVKDWIDVAGFPCAGDQSDADHSDAARRPTADASAVGRLRAAGAVVIAKTKAWGPEPPAAGVVLHPTHPERTPGGSSTGEAVAIASGGSLVGIGSDSGGSIRLPASWCGIIGFKPTSGLVPITGHFPRVGERYDGRTQIGPLARTVDDIAALSAIMAGPDWRDAGVAPVAIPWNDAVPVRGISFAVVTGEADAGGADDEVVAGVEGVASMLEAAGLRRTSWTAPWLASGLELTRRYWARAGHTGAVVERQLLDWDAFRYRYLRQAEHIDVLVTPTTATVAPARAAIEGDQFIFTLPASLTGSPAIALPSGWSRDGLPLSVQLIGRPWEDHRLLAISRLLLDPLSLAQV